MSLQVLITAPSSPAACAAFSFAHGWGGVPSELPSLIPVGLGQIGYQQAKQYDAVNLYLIASGPSITAMAKVPGSASSSGLLAPGIYPKIVYPSGGGTTLYFQYPPRNVPAYSSKATRYDARSGYGTHWVALSRVDHYLAFDMPFIQAGADASNWQQFLDWAAGGANFDYYPDAGSGGSTSYFVEDDGDRALAYRSPGMYKLDGFKATQVIA